MQCAYPFQLIGKVSTMFRNAAGESIARNIMRVRQMIDTGQQCAEHFPVGNNTADGYAAEIDAMIAALAADQAEPRAIAFCAMIGQRDLQRGFNRFRAGIGVEHMIDIIGHVADKPFCQLKCFRVAHLKCGRIIQLSRLLLNGFGDFGAAVACIHAP